MVRRLKSELPPNWDGTPRFPPRELRAIEVPYTDGGAGGPPPASALHRAAPKGASDAAERIATEFVLKLLKKRLFSSPAAFRDTLDQHRTLAGRGDAPRAQRCPAGPPVAAASSSG